jgi:hypothetical protein
MRDGLILMLRTKSWQPIADIVVPNAKEYANKHGYSFIEIVYEEYFSGFEKIRKIMEFFRERSGISKRYKYAMCMDADTLITNHNKRFDNFINASNDFYICKDVNGINAGVFIIKNTVWSKYFMSWLLEQEGKSWAYCEQDAIVGYRETFINNSIEIIEHPSFNSYRYDLYPEFNHIKEGKNGCWHEGDFILHLPGLGMEKRLEILKNTKIIK